MPEAPKVTEEEVEEYAKMLWQQAGAPDGPQEDFKEQARAILSARQSEQSPVTP